jgi:hypothetical protein
LEDVNFEGSDTIMSMLRFEPFAVGHATKQLVALFGEDGNQSLTKATIGAGNEDFHVGETRVLKKS